MKPQKTAFLLFLIAALYIVITGSSSGRATAANADNTGAPGTSQTCGSCHTGGSYGTVTASIQIFAAGTTTPVSAYVGGTTYDMKVTITAASGTPVGYGFQMTCLTTPGNASVANAYTNLASNVKQKLITIGTFNGRRYVEHNNVTNNNTFTFSWTAPAAGTGSVRFYASGNAVNGASGDNGDSGAAGVTLTLPEAVLLSVSGTTTNVSCNGGSNGAINITASGGTGPYSYNWGGGITSEDRNNVGAGSYTVTVTDNSSATASASFTITQPTLLTVGGSTTALTCNGVANGAINITAAGGTPAYSYNWGSGITTEDRSNLAAGAYTLTVTDSKSCTATSSFSVTQPNALLASNIPGTIACFGGNTAIAVSATGGTLPYSGTGNFTVSAGSYSYTVTDANGCSSTTGANISQPAQLTASANDITIPCSGGSGTVTVAASGGTAPYTGTGSFTVITPGIQNYNVSDANGCTATATSTVSSASGLSVTQSTTNIACNGICNGAVDVSVSGGSQPYTYQWSNNISTQDASNLCAGTYQQTVSDNANCSIVNTYVVNDAVVLAVSIINDSILCSGETALVTASISGGTSPYSYNWGSGITTSSASLAAGNYTLTITDNNSCSVTQSLLLTEPDSLLVAIDNTSNDNGTGNGAINVSVSGGSAPYTFNWSNGAVTEDIAQLISDNYSITVTDANGCEATLINISILNTSISNIGSDQIIIYPNPFSQLLEINVTSGGEISFYNAQGVLLRSETITAGANKIDVSNLPPSLYVAQLNAGDKISHIQLIKNQ